MPSCRIKLSLDLQPQCQSTFVSNVASNFILTPLCNWLEKRITAVWRCERWPDRPSFRSLATFFSILNLHILHDLCDSVIIFCLCVWFFLLYLKKTSLKELYLFQNSALLENGPSIPNYFKFFSIKVPQFQVLSAPKWSDHFFAPAKFLSGVKDHFWYH